MLETSEIARLVIALVVLPFIIWDGKKMRTMRGGHAYMYAAIAIYVSYLMTVLEEFWFHDLFNTMQHLALAIGGVLAFVGALYTRREWLQSQEPS